MRTHILIRFFAIGVAAFSAGCSHVTDPLDARATVIVQRDTLVATVVTAGGVEWMQFTMPVAIHNRTDVPLTFQYCASSIEARTSTDWQEVWSPICSLTFRGPEVLLPGETQQVVLSISAALHGPGGPTWGRTTVSGTYRFTAALLPSGAHSVTPTVSSNTFTLVTGS